jgi:Spy/CpxP family protein refolding chaperone
VKTWKLVLAVLVIFGAGVVTGGMLVRVKIPVQRPAETAELIPATNPTQGAGPQLPGLLGAGRQQFVQRLNQKLDLTPDQSAQIDRIMEGSRERVAKLWAPIAPQAREEVRKVRTQIYAILTPDQKSKFDENFRAKRPRENEPNKLRRETNAIGKEAPRAKP